MTGASHGSLRTALLTLTALRGQGETGDTEITLETGLGYFELRGAGQPGQGGTRITFGDSVVTAGGFTVMRINLDNPPGELAVFSGNAHMERGSATAADLHGGESVVLSGSDPSRYDLSESVEPDSWDAWNSDRDQMLAAEGSSRTAATQGFADNSNPAWNDLDANGAWYNVPGQGNIWSPYDASGAGWDPFGNGNWMWTPQYGYGWVSGYSWGYLPYQCGNWNFYDGFGWGWAPGMGGCAPWWRPALWAEHRSDAGRVPPAASPAPCAHWPCGNRATSDAGSEPPAFRRNRRAAFAEPDGSGGDCRAHCAGISSAVTATAI